MSAASGPTHRYRNIAFLSSGATEADTLRDQLVATYGNAPENEADVVVALGGDGLMLQTLHRFMEARTPIFGMNRGSVGFLMNEANEGRAINEVFLSRQTYQAAKLRITIDGNARLPELIADGVMVATPAGSTAYNLSVGGTILPLNTSLMALTPISAFRPRRWRGALLRDTAKVSIDVMEGVKRPVSAVADHFEVRNVCHVEISMDLDRGLALLHDPGHSLDERILREQFDY